MRSPSIVAWLIALTLTQGVAAQTSTSSPSTAALKKLSLAELMDIEVTSVSRRPEKLSQTASAIQVVTAEDIRRSGVTRLPEALRLASNLYVAQVDSRQWAISARGFNSTTANKLQVLIDGRMVYTPLYSGVFWDVQDTLLEDIDRLEVISGPGATLWGANAVNGVINVTTKSARDTQGPLLLSGGGEELRAMGGLRYGGAVGSDLHYRVYAKYFDRDNALLANHQDAADDWHMGQGGFRVDWEKSGSDLFTVHGDFYEGEIDQLTADAIGVSGGNLIGRWSHSVSERTDWQLQVYYDHTRRVIPGTFAEELDTYDLDFQQHFAAGSGHNVVWGFGYRHIEDDVGNTPGLAFLPARVSRDWLSAFIQDEITLAADRLQLTLGTKVEHNDYTGFELQPSVRLAGSLSGSQTLWAALSRAVRTPSRIDREFFVPRDPPFLLAGGPDFVSEELLAYELGYRVQPRQRLALSLATYYNEYDKLRGLEQVNPPAPFPLVIANGQQGESYGAELTADYRINEVWRLWGGYTWMDLRVRAQPGSTASAESHDPDQQIFLRSSFDLPGNVQLDLAFRDVSRIDIDQVPAYSELDVRLAWRPTPRLEISVVGQNLLHDQHAEFGAAASRRQIERNLYGKIVWGF